MIIHYSKYKLCIKYQKLFESQILKILIIFYINDCGDYKEIQLLILII